MESPERAFFKTVQKEYTIWRKNSKYLYEFVTTHILDWPSYTFSWFNDCVQTQHHNHPYFTQKVLLGTDTPGRPNKLIIAEIRLPLQAQSSRGELGYDNSLGRLEVKQSIQHIGSVLKAEIHPTRQNLIATRSSNEYVHISDSESPNQPMTLSGHKKTGVGISWQPQSDTARLLSAGEDGQIILWDVNNKKRRFVEPATSWTVDSAVEHVAFSPHKQTIFSASLQNGFVAFYDINSKKPITHLRAHRQPVYSVSFNPLNENFLLTASGDRTTALWDKRNLSRRLHSFEGHFSEVFRAEWSPFSETHFMTCSADRRVMVFDVNMIGLEQTPDEANDGPPELKFVHGGHTDKVGDIAWNPAIPWVVGSVADDNVVHFWKMNRNISNH